MSIDNERETAIQNRLEAQNIKVQEIISALIKKTKNKDICWERAADENCYMMEFSSGTFIICRYTKNEGRENRNYIGFRLVSNSNVIFFENEISDKSMEFKILDDFFKEIEDSTINGFFESVLEDINDIPCDDDEMDDISDQIL